MADKPRVDQNTITTLRVALRHALLDDFKPVDDGDFLLMQGRRDAIDFLSKFSDPDVLARYSQGKLSS